MTKNDPAPPKMEFAILILLMAAMVLRVVLVVRHSVMLELFNVVLRVQLVSAELLALETGLAAYVNRGCRSFLDFLFFKNFLSMLWVWKIPRVNT